MTGGATAVLLSGGVDSSVALRLLRDEGRDLRAFYLKIWLEDDLSFLGACPWEEDIRFARAVCEAAGAPLEVVPLQTEYHRRVVDDAIAELRRGRTPSPDIFCNQRIKFGAFLERIGGSFDEVATGHYARTLRDGGGPIRLARGADRLKDQTYFLSRLDQRQLERCAFPIGHLSKSEVRALAAEHRLPNRDRRDSQGLCFLGKIEFEAFVRSHLGERPGPILERDTGRLLGEHRGYWFHTIGQRRGLGLSGGPWFVVGKDIEENAVWVSHADDLPAHGRRELDVEDLHWIAGRPPALPRDDLQAKVRHGERLHACRLEPAGGGRLRVTLDSPDTGLAPGQYAVFYDGEVCLGAGRMV